MRFFFENVYIYINCTQCNIKKGFPNFAAFNERFRFACICAKKLCECDLFMCTKTFTYIMKCALGLLEHFTESNTTTVSILVCVNIQNKKKHSQFYVNI